ncbi:MAG: hypothetical protein H0U53_01145 [Actinobacteria bacterium]|nr:hypothetical protein [Actinomycetota bacterium]
MDEEGPLKAGELIVEGFRRLLKPPFLSLLVLNLFVSSVAASFAGQIDEISVFSSVALAVVSAYLQIAVILAASDQEPVESADHWIKAAVKRRCFWRFALASIFSFILVAAGLLALVIPGFIVGAYVGMGPIAAVVERTRAGDSLRRSVELSVKGRRAVGVIFGLFVVIPNGALQVALYFAPKALPLGLWIGLELATVILFLVALIALTRAFVCLGGRLEPLPAKRASA